MISAGLYNLVMSHKHGPIRAKTRTINGKAREITMYSDNDQALHRQIRDALWKDYKSRFSPNCYAYVKGKSCIDAIYDINKKIRRYDGYIRTDIKNFFPSVSHAALASTLCSDYPTDFVERILSFLSNTNMGISQGSSLSPLLSNIYLIDFDKRLSALGKYYRYSDDILLLCGQNNIDRTVLDIDSALHTLSLLRNDSKTATGKTALGFQFLGFHINKMGVRAALNKKTELNSKIAEICSGNGTVKEQMSAMRQAIVGWQNYFHETYPLPQEWFGVLYIASYGNRKDYLAFCEKCKSGIRFTNEQLEYLILTVSTKFGAQTVMHSIVNITGKTQAELVDTLIIGGKYHLAESISTIKGNFEVHATKSADGNPGLASIFKDLFFAHADNYYLSPTLGGKDYARVDGTPADTDITRHFDGKDSLAICLDLGGHSPALVFDIDIEKTQVSPELLSESKAVAEKIKNAVAQQGLSAFVCYSGYKGYHVWVPFARLQPLSVLNDLGISIVKDVSNKSSSINIEIFPNTLVMGSEHQNIVKLPLGKHPGSLQHCHLLDDDMQEVTDASLFLANFRINDADLLSRPAMLSDDLLVRAASKFPNAYSIYSKCEMIRHVVNKGLINSFLGHYERTLLSYVFPAIGEEGILFTHHVMKDFYSYNFGKTDAFLKKAPPNAVSCPKIRKYLELELGGQVQCSCHFNCKNLKYPSPVLHAEKLEISLDRFESEVYSNVQQLMKAAQDKRELEKQIRMLEKQLDDFFQDNNIQQYTLPVGTLKKTGTSKEKWTIEIE